jgi:hypothetical protein
MRRKIRTPHNAPNGYALEPEWINQNNPWPMPLAKTMMEATIKTLRAPNLSEKNPLAKHLMMKKSRENEEQHVREAF